MVTFVSVESCVSASPSSKPSMPHNLPLPVWARAVLTLLAAVFLFAGGMAEIGGPRLPAGHYATLNGAIDGFIAGDDVPLNQLRPQADTAIAGTVRRSLVRGILAGDGSPADPAIIAEPAAVPARRLVAALAEHGNAEAPSGVIALAAQPRAPPSGPCAMRTLA